MGKRGENEECFDPFGIGHSGLFHVKPIGFLIFEHRFNPEPTMIPRDPSSCPFERGNEQERFLSVWTPGDGHIHEKRTSLGDGDARVITGFALRKKAEYVRQFDLLSLITEIFAAFQAEDTLNVVRGFEPLSKPRRGKFSIRRHDQRGLRQPGLDLELGNHRSQDGFPSVERRIPCPVHHHPKDRNRTGLKVNGDHENIDLAFPFFPMGSIHGQHDFWQRGEHRTELTARTRVKTTWARAEDETGRAESDVVGFDIRQRLGQRREMGRRPFQQAGRQRGNHPA